MSEVTRWTDSHRKLLSTLLLLLVFSVVSGCASAAQAHYRVFNQFASLESSGVVVPVTVYMDKTVITDTLAYPGSIGPLSIGAGKHTMYIGNLPPNGFGPPPLAGATATMAAGTQTSFYLIGPGIFGGILLVATDDTTPAVNSQAKLRVISAVGGPAGPSDTFDVYVVSPGSAPSGKPTWSNIQMDICCDVSSEPPYQVFAPGTYDIDFTFSGSTQVLYTVSSLKLAADQNRTVLLTDNENPFGSSIIADLN